MVSAERNWAFIISLVFCLSTSVLAPSLVLAQDAGSDFVTEIPSSNQKTVSYVLCRLKSSQRKIVRTLKVVEVEKPEKDLAFCNTIYTKNGKDRVVGWGRYRGSCDRIFGNIKSNLNTAGWKCKDISSAGVTRE